MPTQETTLQTKDALNLFAQIWEPALPPKAVVCLVHGLGEHIGRYQHVAEAFNQAGIAFVGYDQRGHGKSPGKRGHVPSYETMLDDLENLQGKAQKRYLGIPCFLYGHSMGGSEVLIYALRRQPKIAGVISTSPWLKLVNETPAWLRNMAKVLNSIAPGFTQANGLDLPGLSRDPAVVQAYRADPLVHNQISARLGYESILSGLWALEHANELTIPLLLVHGSADRLTSAPASQDFAARAGDMCTLKIWDGFYHETHNEPEKTQVIAYTIEWVEQHLS